VNGVLDMSLISIGTLQNLAIHSLMHIGWIRPKQWRIWSPTSSLETRWSNVKWVN
jgi:hypothetical protein